MRQTGSPVGGLSVGLYPTGRAHDVQSGLCKAKRSLKRSRVEHSLRKGLEESEKDGQKRRLNHVNGTRNLSRCSWVCWGCEKGRDGCCMMDMLDLDQEPEFGRSGRVMEMSVKHSCDVFIDMAR